MTYSWPSVAKPFIADIDPNFGTWHLPNATKRHATACFDAVYESNSYGAVDRERERKSEDARVIVLGDSFAEGYGVDRAERFSDRLERDTGIPHLDLSSSGHFGPTQY